MNQKIYLNLSFCNSIVFPIFFMAAVRKSMWNIPVFLNLFFSFSRVFRIKKSRYSDNGTNNNAKFGSKT